MSYPNAAMSYIALQAVAAVLPRQMAEVMSALQRIDGMAIYFHFKG